MSFSFSKLYTRRAKLRLNLHAIKRPIRKRGEERMARNRGRGKRGKWKWFLERGEGGRKAVLKAAGVETKTERGGGGSWSRSKFHLQRFTKITICEQNFRLCSRPLNHFCCVAKEFVVISSFLERGKGEGFCRLLLPKIRHFFDRREGKKKFPSNLDKMRREKRKRENRDL